LVNLLAMTATLVVMALGTDIRAVLAACVVVSGLFIGINNTLITETVMKAAPVERGVASAASTPRRANSTRSPTMPNRSPSAATRDFGVKTCGHRRKSRRNHKLATSVPTR
jgi:hypothetical protein